MPFWITRKCDGSTWAKIFACSAPVTGLAGRIAITHYRLRYFVADTLLAAGYLIGVGYAFGLFARLTHWIPWHPYTALPSELLQPVMFSENVLVLIPCGFVLVTLTRVLTNAWLWPRMIGIATAPTVLHIQGLITMNRTDVLSPISYAQLLSVSLTMVIPLLLLAASLRIGPDTVSSVGKSPKSWLTTKA